MRHCIVFPIAAQSIWHVVLTVVRLWEFRDTSLEEIHQWGSARLYNTAKIAPIIVSLCHQSRKEAFEQSGHRRPETIAARQGATGKYRVIFRRTAVCAISYCKVLISHSAFLAPLIADVCLHCWHSWCRPGSHLPPMQIRKDAFRDEANFIVLQVDTKNIVCWVNDTDTIMLLACFTSCQSRQYIQYMKCRGVSWMLAWTFRTKVCCIHKAQLPEAMTLPTFWLRGSTQIDKNKEHNIQFIQHASICTTIRKESWSTESADVSKVTLQRPSRYLSNSIRCADTWEGLAPSRHACAVGQEAVTPSRCNIPSATKSVVACNSSSTCMEENIDGCCWRKKYTGGRVYIRRDITCSLIFYHTLTNVKYSSKVKLADSR